MTSNAIVHSGNILYILIFSKRLKKKSRRGANPVIFALRHFYLFVGDVSKSRSTQHTVNPVPVCFTTTAQIRSMIPRTLGWGKVHAVE